MRRRHHRYTARARSPLAPRRAALTLLGLVAALVLLAVVQLLRPVPAAAARLELASSTRLPGSPALPFPYGTEAIVAVQGVAVMASSGGAAPIPIASVTKMMTALVVLRDRPLELGASGPSITVTPADVATYEADAASGDSVVPVRAGERLSELEALEGLLIPSGDNIADLLARWDAGSTSAFVGRMNALARRLGLRHTHYAGVSGVDPATVSTAADQLRLAEVCMQNPVFASIVSLPQVTLPLAGVVFNVDGDLGTDGIVGVKTGWIPQGGASFVFAARRRVGARHVLLLGALLGEGGATPLPSALAAAERLVRAAGVLLRPEQVVAPGELVGAIAAPWAPPVRLVAARGATLLAWPGARVSLRYEPASRGARAPVAAGATVGTLTASLGEEAVSVPVVAQSALPAAPLGWRLTHL